MFYILPRAKSAPLEYREHFEDALERARRLGSGTEVYRLEDGALMASIVTWTPPRREWQR